MRRSVKCLPVGVSTCKCMVARLDIETNIDAVVPLETDGPQELRHVSALFQRGAMGQSAALQR